uniref:Potassium channel domain-containing protein n=1 Tax=Salvator merianae TaxID=96440 RepID=A0A8D0DLL6_SALMN
MRSNFLKNYTTLSKEEVEAVLEQFARAVQKGGRLGAGSHADEHSLWDFSNALFFVGSTISTIGYGNRAPKTPGGQLFCVFFALFGIPMNLVFLQHVSRILSIMCEKPARWFVGSTYDKRTTKTLTLLLFMNMGIIVFFCLPCFVFQHVEGWSYSESFYYSFITLSTIGFGDYIIGSRDKSYFVGYQFLAMIWVVFGLAWIGLLFNLMASLLEEQNILKRSTTGNR